MEDAPHPISRMIESARAGDANAASKLIPLLYDQLRDLARRLLSRRPPGQTLQATALVHEAYLRVAGRRREGWEGRGQFFEAAARAMRDILVEQARRRLALKRGGDRRKLPLDEQAVAAAIEPPCEDVLAVNEALEKLESADERKGTIVNLRYFAGLNLPEIAEVLDVSPRTVEREWTYIKAWLSRELRGASGEDRSLDEESAQKE